jgi:hypothetical protein
LTPLAAVVVDAAAVVVADAADVVVAEAVVVAVAPVFELLPHAARAIAPAMVSPSSALVDRFMGTPVSLRRCE